MNAIARTLLAGWLLVGSFLTHPVSAQEPHDGNWNYRIEVFGDIGRGGFYHGNHNLGKGADFGGGVGVRPFSGRFRGLGFEARTVRLSSDEETPVGPQNLRASVVAANAICHFRSDTRVQPYAFGGPGMVRVNYFRACNGCVFNVDPVSGQTTPIPWEERVRATKMGLTMGTGIKIAVHRRLSLRPEVLLVNTVAGSGWNWAWVRIQMGVGLHL